MSAIVEFQLLPPARERATLVTLAAIQFTHILDFMIMMPLGPQLMRVFGISPAQFTLIVASYGIAAAVSGLAGGFILDRFDRKRALLTMYAGFVLATVACALAPGHLSLLTARIAAGAFGGIAGSLVMSMVGDVAPPTRRGRAMGWVAAAFPLASVFGVPAGLKLAAVFGWHAAFFFLAGCAGLTFTVALFVLPELRTAVRDHNPLRQMREIVSHGIHLRAFAVGAVLVMAGGLLIPILAPSLVINAGLNESDELVRVYIIGGLATAVSTPIIGMLSDKVDRLALLAVMSSLAVVVVLMITRLGPSSLTWAATLMAAFMVTMSGRFAPAMAMVANAVQARYRGGFMSVNAALQQAASGAATAVAGTFITREPSGRLAGIPTLGYLATAFFILTVILAGRLRAAAPHVSRPSATVTPVPAEQAA